MVIHEIEEYFSKSGILKASRSYREELVSDFMAENRQISEIECGFLLFAYSYAEIERLFGPGAGM